MATSANNNKHDFSIDMEKYQHLFKEMDVPAKTTLLREGEVAKKAYYIIKGCLRLWFNNNGRDITFQFFFENEGISSVESFRSGEPSQFSIESIEPCKVLVITRKNFDLMVKSIPGYEQFMQDILFERLKHYSKLFLSRIRDNPPKRYADLLKNSPHVIQRVPQHYIASYLGITPVSLSRIRNKMQP